jgi:hypothetical protein
MKKTKGQKSRATVPLMRRQILQDSNLKFCFVEISYFEYLFFMRWRLVVKFAAYRYSYILVFLSFKK